VGARKRRIDLQSARTTVGEIAKGLCRRPNLTDVLAEQLRPIGNDAIRANGPLIDTLAGVVVSEKMVKVVGVTKEYGI
jgi:hypothetical protein